MANSIKKFRERAGLTQAQLAEKLGFSVDSIRRYEAGISEPRWSDIAAMCALFAKLGCTPTDLMAEPEATPTPHHAANGLEAGAEKQDKPSPQEIAAEIAEFRDAINDIFPALADRDAYADILLDLKDNGRIDAPEMRAKIERGIRALEASLVA